MESTVLHTPIFENDIKPSELVKKYIELLSEDNKKYFGNSLQNKKTNCPVCNSKNISASFDKIQISYFKCQNCLSVFAGNDLNQNDIDQLFKQSKSRQYWFDTIWKQTSSERNQKILIPLAEWIDTFLIEHSLQNKNVIEYSPVHWGLAEAWTQIKSKSKYIISNPCFDVKYAKQNFNPVNQLTIESSIKEPCSAIVLFDTLSRTSNPSEILDVCFQKLEKNGLCFITTLLSTGLDLQILGGNSNRWTPPDHLIGWSYEGLIEFVEKKGFKVIEFSTPGVLDIMQLENAVQKDLEVVPSFFKYFFKMRKDPLAKSMLQDFLQRWKLSSLGRLVIQK